MEHSNSRTEKESQLEESTNSYTETKPYRSNPIIRKVQQVSALLDSFGAESRGFERVLPKERSHNVFKLTLSVTGLWFAGCGGLTTMSSFFLGPLLFGLGYKDSMVCGLVAVTIGTLFAAYCATLGPRSGLRQMVGARYIFGRWFIKFVSIILLVGLVGWSVTNCVLGGQILAAVSANKVPIEVGIVIINVITLFVSVFGIKHVLNTEAFSSIPILISLFLLYIVAGKHLTEFHDSPSLGDSQTIKGNYLSFFTLAYSVTATWGPIASDYFVLFPETTSSLYIFIVTFFAIELPSIFGAVLSILIANTAVNYEPWNQAYTYGGLGGLLMKVFDKWNGGGKFLLMVLWLSLISNNIIDTYSSAFGIQIAGLKLDKVPRWLLSVFATIVCLICSLAGRNKFSEILSNFLPMIGYWCSMYFAMLIEENCIFRTKLFIHLYKHEFQDEEYGSWPYYNHEIWNDFNKLTQGIAATLSFLIGVAGAVIGMNQVYWVGPVARKFGEDAGDLGMWLSMGFVAVTYPFFRYLELKKFGR